MDEIVGVSLFFQLGIKRPDVNLDMDRSVSGKDNLIEIQERDFQSTVRARSQ